MTPESIDLAMAELNGWVRDHGYPDFWRNTKSGTGMYGAGMLPKYTEDLNAVARVVGKLRVGHVINYRMRLCEIYTGCGDAYIDATAAQRCEAILRAVGKWVEG